MAYNRRNMTISYPPTMRTIINKETDKIKDEFERIDTDKLSISNFNSVFATSAAAGFATNVIPSVTDTYDLGSDSLKWRDLKVSNSVTIGDKTITSDSSSVTIPSQTNLTTLDVSSNAQIDGNLTVSGNLNVQGTTVTVDQALVQVQNGFVFEGSTADDFETTMTAVDPTQDNTISVPNISGTMVTTGDTGTITSTMIANSTIVNDDIADGTIRAAKLNVASDDITFNNITGTNLTGTLQTAAQPNITSLGTLTSLAVDNITLDNNTIDTSSSNLNINKNTVINGTLTCTTLTQTNASGSLEDDKGEVRAVPQVTQSGAYTLVASDHGKHIYTTANVTVPSGVFSAGQAVSVVNNSTSGITLVQGSGLTLRNAGQTTTGDRTIQNYGLVTIFFVSSTEAYASGSGLA